MNPVLIDFFCKAGGASMGYHRAGFRVIGVDLEPQPNYPFEFVQGDAIDLFDELVWTYQPAIVVGSPPCQKHSRLRTRTQRDYPDFIEPFRAKCLASGLPYVIENVEGAPLIDPVLLCGSMQLLSNPNGTSRYPRPMTDDGLLLRRHRLFESNAIHIVDYRDSCRQRRFSPVKGFINVHGGGGSRERKGPNGERIGHGNKASAAEARALLGIDWMTTAEMNEAIPPVYTEYLGMRLLRRLERAA